MFCFVPGFKSNICYFCGTICCPLCHGKDGAASKLKCHRSHNGITSFLGLTHMQAYAPVTMANAILSLSKSLFISPWRMVPLNSHKGASPVLKKIISAWISISKFSNPGLYLKLCLPLTWTFTNHWSLSSYNHYKMKRWNSVISDSSLHSSTLKFCDFKPTQSPQWT